MGDALSIEQANDIAISRVVHASIDPTVASTVTASNNDDEGDVAKADPDRVLSDVRQAKVGDGLLSDEELTSLFRSHGNLRSVYDEGQRFTPSEHDNIIGARIDNLVPDRKGSFEPMWTSYTHHWKTTLGTVRQ